MDHRSYKASRRRKMNTRKLRNNKAISPIIATLLLILIAIAAGVVVYAYVMGFTGSATQSSSTQGVIAFDQVGITGGSLGNNMVNAYVKNTGTVSEIYNIATGGTMAAYIKTSSSTTQQLQLALLIVITSAWTVGAGSIALSIASADSFSLVYTCSSCGASGTAVVTFMGQSGTLTGTTGSTITFTIPGTLSATSGSLTLASTTIPTSS